MNSGTGQILNWSKCTCYQKLSAHHTPPWAQSGTSFMCLFPLFPPTFAIKAVCCLDAAGRWPVAVEFGRFTSNPPLENGKNVLLLCGHSLEENGSVRHAWPIQGWVVGESAKSTQGRGEGLARLLSPGLAILAVCGKCLAGETSTTHCPVRGAGRSERPEAWWIMVSGQDM